jgi:protease-4
MRRLRRVLAVLAVAVLLLWWLLPGAGPTVKPGSVLVLELGGRYVEAAEPSLLGRVFGDARKPFLSLLSEMTKAQRDERLAGVVLRVRDLDINWGMAQELRDAIVELGDAGRPTLAYLEVGSAVANLEYYVASAAQKVVVAPGAASPVVGLAMEFFFLGGLWQKIGAGVEALGSGEYKSGADTLAGTKMSEPHREMAASLLDSTFGQFVAGIAASRGLSEDFVRESIDRAPATPDELRGLGLVDEIAFLDEAVEMLGDGPVVEAADYRRVDPADVGFVPVARFALVYGSGAVVVGSGNATPTGGLRLTSDTVAKALEEAAEDPEIRAIIFRVDSPGGSPLASDIVWRAAERARAHGKPLVASVSNLAASGGYYVLCGADEVVASPGSLVGSIGVFAIRPVIGGLLEKLGIGVESMTRGEYADLVVASRPLSEAGRARMREEIDAIYELFLERVAAGRGMTRDQVHAAGRGRVFTGAQAAENGLVDGLGGLRTAVRRAKERVGLAPEDDVVLIPYPAPRALLEQLQEALRGAALRSAPGLALPRAIRRLEPLLELLAGGSPLLVPPFAVEIR